MPARRPGQGRPSRAPLRALGLDARPCPVASDPGGHRAAHGTPQPPDGGSWRRLISGLVADSSGGGTRRPDPRQACRGRQLGLQGLPGLVSPAPGAVKFYYVTTRTPLAAAYAIRSLISIALLGFVADSNRLLPVCRALLSGANLNQCPAPT